MASLKVSSRQFILQNKIAIVPRLYTRKTVHTQLSSYNTDVCTRLKNLIRSKKYVRY